MVLRTRPLPRSTAEHANRVLPNPSRLIEALRHTAILNGQTSHEARDSVPTLSQNARDIHSTVNRDGCRLDRTPAHDPARGESDRPSIATTRMPKRRHLQRATTASAPEQSWRDVVARPARAGLTTGREPGGTGMGARPRSSCHLVRPSANCQSPDREVPRGPPGTPGSVRPAGRGSRVSGRR